MKAVFLIQCKKEPQPGPQGEQDEWQGKGGFKGKGHFFGNNAQNNQKDREIEADFLNARGMGKGIKEYENPHEA